MNYCKIKQNLKKFLVKIHQLVEKHINDSIIYINIYIYFIYKDI